MHARITCTTWTVPTPTLPLSAESASAPVHCPPKRDTPVPAHGPLRTARVLGEAFALAPCCRAVTRSSTLVRALAHSAGALSQLDFGGSGLDDGEEGCEESEVRAQLLFRRYSRSMLL